MDESYNKSRAAVNMPVMNQECLDIQRKISKSLGKVGELWYYSCDMWENFFSISKL